MSYYLESKSSGAFYFIGNFALNDRVDPGKYGRNLHIEFSRTVVLSVPALQHRKPVFRFTLCLL